jgi:hypothetical protein
MLVHIMDLKRLLCHALYGSSWDKKVAHATIST